MTYEYVYCIECEKMVEVHTAFDGIGHENIYRNHFDHESNYAEWEVDWCSFPLGHTYCPPPEFEEDWELFMIEPGIESLIP